MTTADGTGQQAHPTDIFLTKEDQRQLVLAFARGMQDNGFTVEQLREVMEWATMIRTSATLLDMVIDGELAIALDETGAICVIGPESIS